MRSPSRSDRAHRRAVLAALLAATLTACATTGTGDAPRERAALKYRDGPVCSCGSGTTEDSIRRAEEARSIEQETAR